MDCYKKDRDDMDGEERGGNAHRSLLCYILD